MVNLKRDFITFPLYIYSRPFKGFYAMKYEKEGRMYTGIVILALTCLLQLAKTTSTGFIIAGYYVEHPIVNVPYTIIMTIAPVLLFVFANWGTTCIRDGKGKLHEVFMTYMYAAYPQLILGVVGLIMTHVVTKQEAVFAMFFYTFGVVLFLFYLFIGLIVIHEYTFFKAITMVLLTIIAMIIIIFVLALLGSLSGEFITFIRTVVLEIGMKL